MKPETKFQSKVIARLKVIPQLWYCKISQRALRGIPDIMICYKGHFVAWELKVPPNKLKPTSLQYKVMSDITRSGGVAVEVTPANLDQRVEELLCL